MCISKSKQALKDRNSTVMRNRKDIEVEIFLITLAAFCNSVLRFFFSPETIALTEND